jgi:hypothetical protein
MSSCLVLILRRGGVEGKTGWATDLVIICINSSDVAGGGLQHVRVQPV